MRRFEETQKIKDEEINSKSRNKYAEEWFKTARTCVTEDIRNFTVILSKKFQRIAKV